MNKNPSNSSPSYAPHKIILQQSFFRAIGRMSLDALYANPLRSLLTTLGIVIGTAIVVIVLSVGSGVKGLILNQVTSITPESLFVEIQVPIEGSRADKSGGENQDASARLQVKTLTLDNAAAIRKLPNVAETCGLLFSQGVFSARGETITSNIYAAEASYARIESTPIQEGRFYTEQEDTRLASVIVLGSEVAQKLFPLGEAVGQEVKLNGKAYQVIGVAAPIGTKFFMNMDELVYVPIRTVQKKIMGINHVSAISIKMKSTLFIESTVVNVEQLLRHDHRIQNPAKDDFVVRTMDEAMDIINSITGGLSALLFGLAFISLVVGGVGIMNVMYVSVTERTREIGLKKALGASPSAIRLQFLLEALMLTGVGGVLGLFAGLFVSTGVTVVARLAGFDWPWVLDFSILFFSFGASFTIGLVFGFAPARRAATLNPIEALRG